jgi:hypothetical protein
MSQYLKNFFVSEWYRLMLYREKLHKIGVYYVFM